MGAHTPGPWKVEQHPSEPEFYTIRTNPGNQYVALVDGLDMGTAKGGQLAANARLIAAAPRMLDLLLRTYGRCHDETCASENCAIGRAILRDVEGENNG